MLPADRFVFAVSVIQFNRIMRFLLRHKAWSIADAYIIKDSSGEPAFQIIGKWFSWGDKLSFRNMQGRELAVIDQKMISLFPKYELKINGNSFARIEKEFSWFNKKFTLDVPGPNDYVITGNFWASEYTFIRRGMEVASVSKRFFSIRETYGIDIIEGEDIVSILATAVVIDLVCHDAKGR
jgi:uncharacterized protein YxjI